RHEPHVALDPLLPAPEFGRITLHGPPGTPTLIRRGHLVDGVRSVDSPLRKVAGLPGAFDNIQQNNSGRREWVTLYVLCNHASAA
ncbi:DUF3410 domain-containing protein, partial [Escherichia coli]|nr:DUF3410 domain-containing protein [Escherichia coli]